MSTRRISARITLGLIDMAAQSGAGREHLRRVAGLVGPEDDVDVFIPIARHFATWAAAMRELRDPCLPLKAGAARRTEDLHVRGFAALTSADGWQACASAIRYTRLTTDSVTWRMDVADRVVTISFHREGDLTLGHRTANECAMASFVAQIRALIAADFRPLAVCFRHPEPAPRGARCHREFFGCPVYFAAPGDEFRFEAGFLDRTPMSSNPAMHRFFHGYAESLLARIGAETGDVVGRVRRALVLQLSSGPPKMHSIARELGMSERSLRRALAAAGLRYQELVAAVRLELARTLLIDRRRPLTDIAFVLGFSEQSAFTRFFRQRTGQTPRAYRGTQR